MSDMMVKALEGENAELKERITEVGKMYTDMENKYHALDARFVRECNRLRDANDLALNAIKDATAAMDLQKCCINELRKANDDLAAAAICPEERQPEYVRRQTIDDCVKAVESLPARVEPISGQNFTYVQRGEAIDAMRHLEI